MTRTELAVELLRDCPNDVRADHEAVADAIRNGATWDELEQMPELNSYPESYIWVKTRIGAVVE